jgi:hypothetical protein
MWFWFLAAVFFTVLIFSSDIAFFLGNFFSNKAHYFLAVAIGVSAFITLNVKSRKRGNVLVLQLSSYSFFFA